MTNNKQKIGRRKPSPLFNKCLLIDNIHEFSVLMRKDGRLLDRIFLGSLESDLDDGKYIFYYAQVWCLDAQRKISNNDPAKEIWQNTAFGFYVWYELAGRLWRCPGVEEVVTVLKDIKTDFAIRSREHNALVTRMRKREKKNESES